jgi:hypothetical protein
MPPKIYGVSFSVKQCRAFGIDPKEALDWLIKGAGFRRFRLMSYWDEHEKERGKLDFAQLDWQIKKVADAGGVVTLCLGARQPRWPENHWPEWAWKLSRDGRTAALLTFIETVVKRYKDKPVIISYQLENEALLKSFGRRGEVDRARLVQEFNLVKKLDPSRPIIMTVSDQWGLPWRRPLPDVVGFSYYHVTHSQKGYQSAHHYAWLHRLRAQCIRLFQRRPVFIHELQLEPWGPKAIWEMPLEEQNKSMAPKHITRSLALAKQTKFTPIDLWGGEWWYWRLKRHKDPSIWQAVQRSLR